MAQHPPHLHRHPAAPAPGLGAAAGRDPQLEVAAGAQLLLHGHKVGHLRPWDHQPAPLALAGVHLLAEDAQPLHGCPSWSGGRCPLVCRRCAAAPAGRWQWGAAPANWRRAALSAGLVCGEATRRSWAGALGAWADRGSCQQTAAGRFGWGAEAERATATGGSLVLQNRAEWDESGRSTDRPMPISSTRVHIVALSNWLRRRALPRALGIPTLRVWGETAKLG